MSDEEKKIIVDEDWKSQVEREREELEAATDSSETGAQATTESSQAAGEIPPASFAMLITTIGSQAMFALGQIPDPATGQPSYQPEVARHHIDTLAVLQEKTSGNLDGEEKQMLDEYLNQLRQIFIARTLNEQPQSQPE